MIARIFTTLLGLVVGAVLMLSVVEASRSAHADGVTAIAPIADGSGSATAAAAPATPPAILMPQAEDIGVLTKLWKGGAFFTLGVVGLYLGLGVWAKLDKKHAWYAATAAGALALTIEGIRKGDTPTAMSLVAVAGPLAGVLIKGPGHA